MAMSDGRAAAPGLRLADRILGWRDRLLCDPRFHRFAARAPIFSMIGRRRSAELFDIATGFVHTQVLVACLRLNLFDLLQDGPLVLDEIVRRTGLTHDALQRLVAAAVALKLLERRSGGRVGLGILGGALNGFPGVKAMMHHNQLLYRDLSDPVALLAGRAGPTELHAFWPYAGGASERAGLSRTEAEAYSNLMAASQGFVADDVLDAYDMRRHRRLMDVGGGDGSFLRSAAARAPHLALALVDLPAVVETARDRFAAAGLTHRATLHPTDFHEQRLPGGADAISLVRVAHDHDDPVVQGLFSAAHAALEPGGSLLVAEPMAGVPGAERMADAYFGFYLLAMGTGRARTPDELSDMLRKAGFARILRIKTRRPLLASLLVAKKET
jgi:demethylspheroidene O-methyltransferase